MPVNVFTGKRKLIISESITRFTLDRLEAIETRDFLRVGFTSSRQTEVSIFRLFSITCEYLYIDFFYFNIIFLFVINIQLILKVVVAFYTNTFNNFV